MTTAGNKYFYSGQMVDHSPLATLSLTLQRDAR